MLTRFSSALLVCTGLALSACDRASSTPAASAQLACVATTGMVADAVRLVGGPHVQVEQLMRSGTDPHTYKMLPGDGPKMEKAAIVFFSGHHLEGTMADMLHNLKNHCALGETIPKDRLLTWEGSDGSDPHVWNDLVGWQYGVRAVAAKLAEKDAAHGADYAKAADAYCAELAQLDAYCKEVLTSIPKDKRVIVTSHDAFAYFGKAYEMEVMGIQGISTADEASRARISALVETLVQRKIPAVFVESSVSPANIEALVAGAKAKGHSVRIGGELFSDAMGAEGTWEGTFIGMLDHNATLLSRSLGGSAPEGGFREWRKNQQATPAK